MRIARMSRLIAWMAVFLWAVSAEAGETYRLYVDGLACPFCAYGVEKKVGGLDGVAKIRIDIDGGVVVVTMAEDATLGETAAKRAIDEAGFTLRAFEAPKTE